MALIDKASLLMVPSTYEAGTLYNVLPSGNRAPDSTDQNSGYDQTRADFDFDRGSNAAATRVNASGLIEKYRENLLLQSNNFSNASWVLNGATLTSGQSGYDGSSDAWSLTSTTLNGSHRIIQTFTGVSNSIVTYSVFAKSNGYNFLRIVENASTGDFATFNLSNGSVANNTAIANAATISSVGNGWYRCSISVDGGNNTRFDIYTMETSGTTNFVGDGVSGAYIQDAQAELGLAASPYIETGASTAQAGVLVDLPRINYDANGENGALLLEPSRQQLVQYSEYFGGWGQINTINTANSLTSPEGLQNANKLIAASGVNNNVINQQISAGTYTASVFAKKGEFEGLFIGSGPTGAFFNLNTYAYRTHYQSAPTSHKIEDYGNGWHRYSITFTISGNDSLYIGPNDNVSNTLGVTGNNSNGIYIYGAQIEAGSYPSSYIPNHSGTGGVTRAADSCDGAGNADTFNDSEGVLYAEISTLSLSDTSERRITISNTSNNSYLRIQYGGTSGTIYLFVYINGVKVADIRKASLDTTNKHKVAIRYGSAGYSGFVDGVLIETDAYAGNFVSYPLNSLDFYQWKGDIKQISVFDTALTDAECVTLTTL